MNAKHASATLQGISHKFHGLPCQDEACTGQSDSCAVAAICDGAGSCAHSELAAQALCRWIVCWLPDHFDELYPLDDDALVDRVLEAGLPQLDRTGLPRESCSCTLVCAARHQDGRLLILHIGDGFVFSANEVLSYPENGLFAEETYFFNAASAASHLRVVRRRESGSTSLLLTSDGCGDALYDARSRAPVPAVAKLCHGIAQHTSEEVAAALKRNLEVVIARESDDDLSLAMLWCDPPEETTRASLSL